MSSSCQSGGCNITPTIAPVRSLHLNISKDDMTRQLEEASSKLIRLAYNSCWNKLSKNIKYVLTDKGENQNSAVNQSSISNQDKLKKAQSLTLVSQQLNELFSDLYDVNLFVFKAKKDLTIIEVQYLLKSRLDKDYLEIVKDTPPTFHCKLRVPPYHSISSQLYDINWHLGGWRHQWKMFWFKRKMKGKINPLLSS